MSSVDDFQKHARVESDSGNSAKRILIATIGSRGEVQPALALAVEFQALGRRAALCVPPNFKTWVESFGVECIPIGPDVQKFSIPAAGAKRRKPTRQQIHQLVHASVTDQFRVMTQAADGCDLIVVCGDLQHAARSIAEVRKIPYVHAVYCPVTLQSPNHPPPTLGMINRSQSLPKWANRLLWKASEWHWNGLYRDVLNEQRAALGLMPIKNVPAYIATEQPWVAVDAVIAPVAVTKKMHPIQTGAWFLSDERPLPDELEAFLAAGEPPIYFGFGSMQARERTGRIMIDAARALNRRAIISQGWGNLHVNDSGVDSISIGDVSHERLFPRVAAIVHHGGAGTMTAAARAGTPQVVVPHIYDQYYWAHQVEKLGIGVSAGNIAQLTADKLTGALRQCLLPDTVVRAKALAPKIELQGARIAAERLLATIG